MPSMCLRQNSPLMVFTGGLTAGLDRAGRSIGASDLPISAHAPALGHAVLTDNVREFSRVDRIGFTLTGVACFALIYGLIYMPQRCKFGAPW
jgi:hypothetical protein